MLNSNGSNGFTISLVAACFVSLLIVAASLTWAVTHGQTGTYTAKLRFVPLPKSVLVVDEKAIAKIHG